MKHFKYFITSIILFFFLASSGQVAENNDSIAKQDTSLSKLEQRRQDLIQFMYEAKLKKADKLYNHFAFVNAVKLYKELYDDEYRKEYVTFQIADCIRLIGEPGKSEPWYAMVVKQDSIEPIIFYYYAQALRYNGKYDLAQEWVNKFHLMQQEDTRGKKQIKSKKIINSIKARPLMYVIDNMTNLNCENADFGAVNYHDKIVYASARREGAIIKSKHSWNDQPFLDLFIIDPNLPDTLQEATLIDSKINTRFHEGPLCFSADYKTMYFTRNNFFQGKTSKSDKGVNHLNLFKTEFKNGSWTKFKAMPFNNDNYSVGHPSLSRDGSKLFFTSDMPGGLGETDIYFVEILTDSTYGNPKNLGPNVNTEGKEMFPYIHHNNTLYFSSDGHVGFGGLDVFYSVADPTGFYTNIINLGLPINSPKDDFAFVLDTTSKAGFFASNRPEGAGGDDIYEFTINDISHVGCDHICEHSLCVSFHFTGSIDEKHHHEYEWDFGDGKSKKGIELTHCYEKIGNYKAVLTRTLTTPIDTELVVRTIDINLNNIDPRIAMINSDNYGIARQDMEFDGSELMQIKGKIVKYYWDMGDGSVYTKAKIKHQYRNKGKYEINLTIGVDSDDGSESCCEAISTKSVEIFDTENDKNDYISYNNIINISTTPTYILHGKVIDEFTGKPLPLSDVEFIHKNNTEIELTTDSLGNFSTPIDWKKDYKVVAFQIDYTEKEVDLNAITGEKPVNLYMEIALNTGPMVLIQGKVFDKLNNKPFDNIKLQVETRLTKTITDVHVDPKTGVFEKYLDSDMDYLLIAEIDSFFTKTFPISANDKMDTLVFDIAMEKIELGKAIKLENIYYDLAKHFIRKDAAIELDKLVKLLEDNPTIEIELSSHTDCRSSDSYNMALSDRRAKAATKYIVENGISKDRITGKGYGETMLVNECANGVRCSEKKHQDNRRTEFKVTKM